jgi:anti-sigma B factor antagonist
MPKAEVSMDVRQVAPGISVIDIQGEFTAFSETVLMEAYSQSTAAGARVIILNFAGVDYMNSRGIGLLVTLLIRVNRGKQKLLTYGLSEHYRTIFQITRLDDAVAIYDTEAEAVRAAQTL